MRDPEEAFKELETLGMGISEEKQNVLLKSFVEYDGPKLSFENIKTQEGIMELCNLLEIPFDGEKYFEFKDSQIQPFVKPMLERHESNMNNMKLFYKGCV